MVHKMMTFSMMTATMSFSVGLIAFCSGIWLTIWSTTNGREAASGKLAGYFIVVLSIITLVLTSYHSSRMLFSKEAMVAPQSYSRVMNRNEMMKRRNMEHKPMKKEAPAKPKTQNNK